LFSAFLLKLIYAVFSCLVKFINLLKPAAIWHKIPSTAHFGHIYVGPCHAACPLQLHIN